QRASLVTHLDLQLRQLVQRVVIVLVHFDERFQRFGRRRLVAALLVYLREQFIGVSVTALEGEEFDRALQMRDGLIVVARGEIYSAGAQIEREIVRRRSGFGQYLFLRRLRVAIVPPGRFERLDVFIDFAAHVIIELAVEVGLRELQRLRQDFRSLLFLLVAAQHFENRVETGAFIDEVANLRSLEVGQGDVVRAFGLNEDVVQVGYREPPVFGECLDVFDAPIVAPSGPSVVLLEDAQPLRKPPRDQVVGGLQRDDVRVFVPERAPPVDFSFARRRRILRDDLTE